MRLSLQHIDYITLIVNGNIMCFYKNSGPIVGCGLFSSYTKNGKLHEINKTVIFDIHNNDFFYNEIEM